MREATSFSFVEDTFKFFFFFFSMESKILLSAFGYDREVWPSRGRAASDLKVSPRLTSPTRISSVGSVLRHPTSRSRLDYPEVEAMWVPSGIRPLGLCLDYPVEGPKEEVEGLMAHYGAVSNGKITPQNGEFSKFSAH